MGASLSWVAVEALTSEEVLNRLSLTRTSTQPVYPFKGIACHTLEGGWFLVVAGRCDHKMIKPANMSLLSKGCRAVACSIEEHVNFARAELWKDGVCIWHVQHQGDEDSENMSSDGQVPQRFHDLLATAEPEDSESLDGHFHMDIPLLLAKELCGFRHDEANTEFDSTPYVGLTERKPKRSWWRLW